MSGVRRRRRNGGTFGRLVLVSGASRSVIRQEPDGTLVTHADLGGAFEAQQWNEIAVDGRGNAYLNNIAFDFPGGEFRPGLAALATPDGAVRQVADGFGFPNGMAVTPDDTTLLVAESCALGGPEGRTLLMVVADWAQGPAMFTGDPTGRILALDVAVPAPPAVPA